MILVVDVSFALNRASATLNHAVLLLPFGWPNLIPSAQAQKPNRDQRRDFVVYEALCSSNELSPAGKIAAAFMSGTI